MNIYKKLFSFLLVGILVIGGMFLNSKFVQAVGFGTVVVTRLSTTSVLVNSNDNFCTESVLNPADFVFSSGLVANNVVLSNSGGCELTITTAANANTGLTGTLTYNTEGGSDLASTEDNPIIDNTSFGTVIDSVKPVPVSATFYDTNNDGKLDTISVIWSEAPLTPVADGSADWAITSAADFADLTEDTVKCNSGGAAGNECIYNFTTSTVKTDVGDLTLEYDGTSVTDGINTANSITFTSASTPAFTDGAAPVLVSIAKSKAADHNILTFTYSELVNGTNGASSSTSGDITTAGTVAGFGSFATPGDASVPTGKNTVAGFGTNIITVTLANQTGGFIGGNSPTEPSGIFTPVAADAVVDTASPTPLQVNTAVTPTGGGDDTWDLIRPTVSYIHKVGSADTNAASVDFSVKFSEDVTDVKIDGSDFITDGTVVGSSITGVTATDDPSIYTFSVNTGTGNGTLWLDIVSGMGVMDLAGNIMTSTTSTSDIYTINKSLGGSTGSSGGSIPRAINPLALSGECKPSDLFDVVTGKPCPVTFVPSIISPPISTACSIYGSTQELVKEKTRGINAKGVQNAINQMKATALPLINDGIIGPLSEVGIKNAQKILLVTLDGIWGPKTQQAYVLLIKKQCPAV